MGWWSTLQCARTEVGKQARNRSRSRSPDRRSRGGSYVCEGEGEGLGVRKGYFSNNKQIFNNKKLKGPRKKETNSKEYF